MNAIRALVVGMLTTAAAWPVAMLYGDERLVGLVAALAAFLERTADPLPCPEGVYNPRPGLDQYLAECSGGNRNGFYGAGEVNAANAVK